MGEDASDWAADSAAAPSLSDELPSSVYDPIGAISVSSRTFTEAQAGDGTIGDSIDLRLANGTFAGADGDSLAEAITADNVPAGLTLVAERTGDRRVRLSLEGSAEHSGALDGIDDLTVAISDDAFSRAPSTGTREFAFRVDFEDPTLNMDPTRLKAAADGAVDVSATLTLNGARFAGANGRDLVADGALALPGLPEGVAATAILDDAHRATLRLTGSLGDAQRAAFGLDFADAAFDGTAAASVRGDGISGLATVAIERDQRWREKLSALLAEAELVVRGAYSSASFSAFETARDGATETLANESTSDDDLRAALDRLTKTADALQITGTPYRVLEAEEFDDSSGGRLSPESGNIGGVQVGSWIAYDGIDFGGTLPKRVKLRYANHPGDSATDEHVEVRVGAVDGPVAARVELELTDGWDDYVTAEATVDDPEALDGSNRIYFVFGGTPDPSQPNSWVANLDRVQFLKTAEDGPETAEPVRIEAETYDADNGNGLKKEGGEPPAGNVGGTWDGGRLTYDGRDLGQDPLTQVTVSASTRDDRVGDNRRLEFYLDEVSETTRVGTVDLPKTGGWGSYVETTAELDEPVSGTHRLIVVMRADAVSGQEFNYVANLQWFEFGPQPQEAPEVDLTGLNVAIDDAEPLLAREDRYVSIDFAVFRAALDEAKRVAAADRTTQDEADEAQRVLDVAAGQLEWRAVRQVSVSATTRTLAGKQYVSVAVTNGADTPLDLEVETPYGSRSFTAVQPGASANVSINSRQATIPAGEVKVTVTGLVGDETVTADRTASYSAAG
ncbi:carbohydrate-binding protein [Promicromonospora sp. CA-289599]|uniref:carbohydrate-binding protein n=1 Tax=Promicromonospora sp. CA-289599 TaxID=3240014 RepID=UPI003D8E1B1E